MDAGLIGIGSGVTTGSAAFTLLGTLIRRDYRGVTTWHVRQTMSMASRVSSRATSDASFERQLRLERFGIGTAFMVGGAFCCLGGVVAICLGIAGD